MTESYGARELKSRYRKYLLTGLGISLIVHIFLLGVYWTSLLLARPETGTAHVLIVRYADLGPPPSLQNELLHGLPSAKLALKDFSVGVPVPVPEFQVHDDKPFPTQEELSQAGTVTGEGNGGGISIPDSVRADLLTDLEGITPDTPPVLLKMVVPQYPESAMQKKISGTVWVNVLVNETGGVKSASVIKSDAEDLNQAAVEAARKYTFSPGIYRNKPIPVWVSIPIRFKLEGD